MRTIIYFKLSEIGSQLSYQWVWIHCIYSTVNLFIVYWNNKQFNYMIRWTSNGVNCQSNQQFIGLCKTRTVIGLGLSVIYGRMTSRMTGKQGALLCQTPSHHDLNTEKSGMGWEFKNPYLPFLFGKIHDVTSHMQWYPRVWRSWLKSYKHKSRGGWGTPQNTNTGMRRPTRSWFWDSWSRSGYPYSRLLKNGLLKFTKYSRTGWLKFGLFLERPFRTGYRFDFKFFLKWGPNLGPGWHIPTQNIPVYPTGHKCSHYDNWSLLPCEQKCLIYVNRCLASRYVIR